MLQVVKIISLSCKRRRRDMRLIRIVAFLSALFITGMLLYQQCAGNYLGETAKLTYGDWVIAWRDTDGGKADSSLDEHPYLEEGGVMIVGAQLCDLSGRELGMIGTMDTRAQEIAQLEFYEGRYPQADNEVAVETHILSSLGLPYELGQQLQMEYIWREEGEEHVEQVEYTVVGILKSYSTIWAIQGAPALVTESALEQIKGWKTCDTLYPLKEEYKRIDTEQFYNNLKQELQTKFGGALPSGVVLEYNSYAYAVTVWDSEQGVILMAGLLILIGVAVLIYLFLVYLIKRKPYYYRFRSMGMSKGGIRLMTVYECGYTAFPVALAGIVIAYVLALGACAWLASRAGIPFFFEFRLLTLLVILAAVSVTILLAILISFAITGSSRLNSASQALSAGCLRRLRKLSFTAKKPEKQILKREQKRFRLRVHVLRILSVAVCLAVLLCSVELYKGICIYRQTMKSVNDFDAAVTVPVTRRLEYNEQYWMEMGWDKETLGVGFTDSFFQEMELIPYYQECKTWTEDEEVLLDWKGRTESPYFQALYAEHPWSYGDITYADVLNPIEENDNWDRMYGCYFTPEVVREARMLEELAEEVTWDEEALQDGEEVIVLCTTYNNGYIDANGEFVEGGTVRETTLNVGDMLTIESEDHTAQIQVRIGGIIYNDINSGVNFSMKIPGDFVWRYGVLAADAVGERLAEAKGVEFLRNKLEVNFRAGSSYEASAKKLSGLIVAHGGTYTSGYDTRIAAREALRKTLILYGSFGVMVLAFYLIVRINLWEAVNVFRQERVRKLHQCGMEWKRIRSMYRLEGMREMAFGCLAIPLAYGCYYLKQTLYYRKTFENSDVIGVYSEWQQEISANSYLLALEDMVQDVSLLICLALLLLIAVLTLVLQERMLLQGTERKGKD